MVGFSGTQLHTEENPDRPGFQITGVIPRRTEIRAHDLFTAFHRASAQPGNL